MRIIAETEKCIASGNCVLACLQVFAQRESDGVVHVLDPYPSLSLEKSILQAVQDCPAQVFRVENAEDTSAITVVDIG